MRISLLNLFFLLFIVGLSAQSDFYKNYSFTKADSLRGGLRPERTCYDVHFYGLNIKIDPKKKQLSGYVDMAYGVEENFTTLQIDLFENMTIDRITMGEKKLDYDRNFNAVFVHFPSEQIKGTNGQISIHYHGQPQEAKNPPWDGGIVWAKDEKSRPWYAMTCEGDGASLWWPNKDHLSDEPDSMLISIAVPSRLTAVCNGNLKEVKEEGSYTRYDWTVGYPIDNYNVSFNIGYYTQFSDTYYSFDGDSLALDYYVLDYNVEKAMKHFEQTKDVLACYEHYMGKYPFWNDGFALVETPYLGMEHQGAIAYGNRYMRGYLGGMIPLDMNWDYIIVHETGHEYYGNSIGCNDLSEMWIQESFTTYLESLFVEYTMSKADAVRYLKKQQYYISNRQPILGPMDVNWENWSASDHYFKGAWVLHTLRNAIGDDDEWFRLFRLFYQQNKLSLITTQDVNAFFNKETDRNWDAFFEQYLVYPSIPVLEYKITSIGKGFKVRYRWQADVASFDMPILLGIKDNFKRVEPSTTEWNEIEFLNEKPKDFEIAINLFLVETREVD